MRPNRLALLLLAALPAAAPAKPWQGVTPGQTGRAEVVSRFGEPSTQGKRGERTLMVYKGDQALAGTRQAQFFLREDGVVVEIAVFPASQLDRESVEGTYGRGAQKTFTDDFRPVWIYKALGITVVFGKDGNVDSITFAPAEGTPARGGGAPAPRPEAPADAQAR